MRQTRPAAAASWRQALVCLGATCGLAFIAASPLRAAPGSADPAECAAPASGPIRGPSAFAEGESRVAAGDLEAALEAYRAGQRDAAARGEPLEALQAEANALRISVQRLEEDATASDPSLSAELEDAYQRCTALDVGPGSVRLRIHLGRTALDLAQKRPALSNMNALAARAWREAAEAARAIDDPRQESYAQGYLGELYRARGHSEEALVLVDRALFAAQQADALEATSRWRGDRAELLLELGREQEALVAYREAVTTLGQLRAETGSLFLSSAEDQALYLSLVDLLLREAANATEPTRVQDLLGEARDVLEDQKAAELRDYFSDPCLATTGETASDSVAGAIIVYPVALPDRLELIVSGHGRLERFQSRVALETLDREVRAFRRGLQRRTTRQYLRQARMLYAWLIEPIEALLDKQQPEALVFVPGGTLRTIPFGALQRASDQTYLIERYAIAVIPSLLLTEPSPIDRSQIRLLAAGLSVSVQGFPALEHVKRELDGLTPQFPNLTLRNSEFSTSRFERELKTVPYGIIHLASHGEFNGDPNESFLLTHDGKVTMNDLSSWITATQFRADTPLELLTLSACQTAIGNDRAALGLAGVALRAGARSVLATLWSVNDEATARVIDDFYARLGTRGVSRAQALQLAQKELIATSEYRHPAFWAPFLLLNDWQ